jgi:prohibitin 2
MVDIGLRVLYRPEAEKIGFIAQTIGEDFSDKVLPSIIHDTLKSVMARYNAASLLTKRNEVKKLSFIFSIIF